MAEVVVDAGASGLDAMVGALIGSAIEKPEKAAILDAMRGTVTIAVPDAEVAVGLRFSGGTCRVHAGPIVGSTVRITMPSDTLMGFGLIPLQLGMPSLFSREGRDFHRKLLTGQVKIGGLRHLGLITQLNRLLSLL